jgi:hypothetical protein
VAGFARHGRFDFVMERKPIEVVMASAKPKPDFDW